MLNVYLNEYEQWNALKKWWQKYNAIIVMVFSLFLLSCSAYKYWTWHQASKNQIASNTYEQMMLASANHQPEQIKLLANTLVHDYPDSIYADAARLYLAKVAVIEKDYDKAEKELLLITEHSRIQEIADVAKIRLARIWMGHQKYIKALKILKDLKSNTYLPLVDELRGDIYTSMNQYDKAVRFYQKALTEVQDYGVGNLFLEMKSNDLATISQQNQLTQTTNRTKNA